MAQLQSTGITGSLILTGSQSLSGSLNIYNSGSTVLDIQGSTGQLFSITDSLTGSLFSVNTVAGLPIIEAFSDNTVNIGKFGQYPVKIVNSGTEAVITGSFSGSVAAPGSTTQIVYNSGGALAADSGFVYSGSNVGIGTSTPSYKFTISEGIGDAGGNAPPGVYISLSRASSGASPGATYFTDERYTLNGTNSFGNSLGKQLYANINSTGTNTVFRNVMSRVHTNSAGAAYAIAHYSTHAELNGTGTVSNWFGTVLGGIVSGFPAISSFQGTSTITNTYGLFLGSFTVGTQTNAPYAIYQAGTEKIYLQGNVGIGTTSPSAKLHVKGSGTTSSTTAFRVENSSASPSMVILDDGNVGIGITSPSYPLVINKNGINNYIELQGDNNLGLFANGRGLLAFDTSQDFIIYTGGINERVRVNSSGNVGIGTTSPTYRVDVQGTNINSSSVRVQGAYDINPLANPPAIGGYTLSAGTNLGVGQYYYRVVYVTAIGETGTSGALSVVTTTGNTTVNLTDIPISSDPRVTAHKLYRTPLNQSSDGQRFLSTINDNTTTTYTDSTPDASLTGVLLQAYKVNTTSRYITVAGVQGMVIDSNLTALGRNAGNAIIASSGPALRTVLIGAQAGQNITTGQGNVIVGVAGGNLTTGGVNTLMGDLAGYNLISGAENVILGSQAGRFLQTTSQNVIIGAAAARYLADGTTQFTSGANNVVIGENIRMATITDTNSIVIGQSAQGLGSNTTVIGNSSTTFTSFPAGNLAVGTTTDSGFKLDVNGTGRFSGNVQITGSATNSLRVKGSGTTSSTTALRVENSSASPSMVVLDDGNVGIGITSPDAKLHVANLTLNNSAYQHLKYITANNSTEASGESYSGQASYGIGFRRQWSGGIFTNLAGIYAFGSGGWRGGLLFRTKNNTTSTGEPDIDALLLSPSGNVGIGTTSPSAKLHVKGSGATSATTAFRVENSAATAAFIVRDDGNVGIGTTNPVYKLHVNGSFLVTTNSINLEYNNGIIYHGSSYYQFPSGGYYHLYGRTGMGLIFGSNNAEVGRFDLSGNLGIGTTSPLSKLHVKAATNQNFRISAGTNLEIASINDADSAYTALTLRASTFDFENGNVGIGTDSPLGKLDISTTSGDTIFRTIVARGGTATSNDLAIKQDFITGVAANYLWSNGNYMLGVGRNGGAMPSSESDATDLSHLVINSSGNVGIGTTSPTYKLELSGSTAAERTIGIDGDPVVYYPDQIFSAYAYSIALGNGLRNATNTGGNAGTRNTAIGISNQTNVTTGGGNASVGSSTLEYNTTGNNNTTMGHLAGQEIRQSYNTALGFGAMRHVATGSNNVALGYYAGYEDGSSNTITQTNNSLYLGNLSKASSTTGNTNEIVIGYQAQGLGSNTVVLGNDSITTTALKGNVGIGTTSPTAKLHVKGSGTTSSTTALLVQNSAGTTIGTFRDDGKIILGSTAYIEVGTLSNFYNTSVGYDHVFRAGGTEAVRITGTFNVGIGTATPQHRLDVSGSVGIYKSGSTILDVQGSQGQLFSVVDSLTGSLMSVNDVSGLPILEVFSDDRVEMGTYGNPAIIVSGSSVKTGNVEITGSLIGQPINITPVTATASLDCSLGNFFDLTLSSSYELYLSASNIQAGQTMNLRITQPATSGSLTYGSEFKFPGGIPYEVSATGSAVDIVSFISFDSSTLYGTAIKNLS